MTGEEIRSMYENRIQGMDRRQLKQQHKTTLSGIEREIIEARLKELNGNGGNNNQKKTNKAVKRESLKV